MLQLLSPAGSTEAVIAAVQSGADIIYMGYGVSGDGRGEMGFSPEQLRQAIRYCRARGCRTVLALGDLCTDEGLDRALGRAKFAAENGVDAVMVQDLGLVRLLRSTLPELPVWGDVRMGVDSLDGALAAAGFGLECVVLSPELSLEQIRIITQAPIKTAVYVHGQLCFSHAGQCYMSALADRQASASCGRCADLCRRRFSLGGRMDDYPLSMKDICLLAHLQELEEAGVDCAAIEGHSRSPEFVSFATGIYARAIQDRVMPTQEEREWLSDYFATNGLTDGYFTARENTDDMFGVIRRPDRDARRMYQVVRKDYMNKERRRIPLKFFAVIQPGQPARFAAEDDRGNRATCEGFVPIDLGREGISEDRIKELFYRTGGTPYTCAEVNCHIAERMDYPDEAVEDARRELINQIAQKSREPGAPVFGRLPPAPENKQPEGPMKLIFQVSRAEQLSEALACCEPDYLYVPAEIVAAGDENLRFFRERGCQIVAVMPRVINEDEFPEIQQLMLAVKAQGVAEILAGSLRYLRRARMLGLGVRGDSGLNAANSACLEQLRAAGLVSATLSFELSAAQIRAMAKPLDTEMIVYGRLPVMISEQCIMRRSAGRCRCEGGALLQDEHGAQYYVMKEYGCRNVIFDSSKVYLADKQSRYADAGLWGARLLFTGESARECVEVARQYKFTNLGRRDWRPNNTSRGLYAKGALT